MRINSTIIVCVLFVCCGCSPDPTYEVEYVIPNNYKGEFFIELNSPDGTKLQKKSGKYVLIIPSTGKLRIRGEIPFNGFQEISARFEDGTKIPFEAYIQKDEKGLWLIEKSSADVIRCFVGTKSEYEKLGKR